MSVNFAVVAGGVLDPLCPEAGVPTIGANHNSETRNVYLTWMRI